MWFVKSILVDRMWEEKKYKYKIIKIFSIQKKMIEQKNYNLFWLTFIKIKL
jgi:hypothetical protein